MLWVMRVAEVALAAVRMVAEADTEAVVVEEAPAMLEEVVAAVPAQVAATTEPGALLTHFCNLHRCQAKFVAERNDQPEAGNTVEAREEGKIRGPSRRRAIFQEDSVCRRRRHRHAHILELGACSAFFFCTGIALYYFP